MTPSRRARDLGKRALFRVFALGQRVGVDILPRHFYSSVPDVHELATSSHWRAASEMPGVRGTDLDAQVAEVRRWFTPEVVAALRATSVHDRACAENGAEGYGPMESQLLHAFVATRRPRRVVQIGAGVSTSVMLAAADRHGVEIDVTCVDPFPTDLLVRLADEGLITLIREPAQTVSLDLFAQLEAGDLLFVDSTHTVRVGSEVNRLVLEVFPRLAAGVTVHVHDILFPYGHQPDILSGRLFFWEESTLLHAFLIDNDRAAILVSESMLAHARTAELGALLVGYRPARTVGGLVEGGLGDRHLPSATWLAIS